MQRLTHKEQYWPVSPTAFAMSTNPVFVNYKGLNHNQVTSQPLNLVLKDEILTHGSQDDK